MGSSPRCEREPKPYNQKHAADAARHNERRSEKIPDHSGLALRPLMDYRREYDEYWSRTDRWGSHSFDNPEWIADHILSTCGKAGGRFLDVGFGMGLLVRTLLRRGVDAFGLDVAERVVTEADRFAPGRFKLGSILAMPYPDEAFQTVISTDCLEHIAEEDVPQALAELYRVTRRYLFIQLATTPDRDNRWHLTIRDRAWWESRFFEAGFRKHPAIQSILPYESLEKEGRQITLPLEKIPPAALAAYPLATLKAERDLHMDMLRESGRRSDAHIARYTLARQYLPEEGLILDAACGLGYGSAILADAAPGTRVIAIDSSAFAIDYARASFLAQFPNLEFRRGDVCRLEEQEGGSVAMIVSFETIEHLKAPEQFLREVQRVLKPGGRFIGSIPDRWVDKDGHDPNPWHFHVFDFSKLVELCGRHLVLNEAYRQNAGGGMKLPQSPRQLRRVNLPVTSGLDDAEWWIISATKPQTAPLEIISRAAPKSLVLLTDDPEHSLYSSWLPFWNQPWKRLDLAAVEADLRANAAILVTHDTYLEPGRSVIRKAMAMNIPTLILADGILEYRNTWDHPQLTPGAIFQPVLGHKIACLGRSQARYLESWGNIGKCEVVGSTRFDRYYGLKRRQKRPDEPFRLLVMTALTPYFTERQRHLVHASLRDLREFFARQQTIGGFGIQVVWRLTKGLDQEIGVASTATDLTGTELAEVLQTVDAVITTPSTAMLEAMILGLPVAALDYTNSPAYVQPAWRISAPAQIPEVVAELLNPPEPKLLFQDTTLHDCLECFTPATPRLIQTILTMIECGLETRQASRAPQFPWRILKCETDGHHLRENRFEPDKLYQAQPLLTANNHPQKPFAIPQTHADQTNHSVASPAPASDSDRIEVMTSPNGQSPAAKGKLLFVSHESSRTGAPMFLLNLIQWLREHGRTDFRIVLRADGPLRSRFQELGETHVVHELEPVSPLLEGVSLIYSNTCTNGVFLRPSSSSGIPILTHVHEMEYTIESFGHDNFEEVRRHTCHYIACSNAVREGLHRRRQIPAERITVIPEGIPVQSVLEGAAAWTPREARQWCGFEDGNVVIAACGFADWRKGPDLFVQLADSLRRYTGDTGKIGFLWIGQLPHDERGKALLHDVSHLGLDRCIKFIGEQDNPYPFLNLCDIFCLCSREDPFPLVMLEAGALGKPTICFEKAGGASEFCTHGGGFVVPYLNLEAMGQRLIQLIENEPLRRRIGKAAARLVRNEYKLGIVAPRIRELIERFEQPPRPVEKPVEEPVERPIEKPEPPPTFGRRVRIFGKSIAQFFGPKAARDENGKVHANAAQDGKTA